MANLLSEDFAEITDDGLFDKAGVLANLDNLTVTDYAPTDFKIRNLAPNTIQLIFKVTVHRNLQRKGISKPQLRFLPVDETRWTVAECVFPGDRPRQPVSIGLPLPAWPSRTRWLDALLD